MYPTLNAECARRDVTLEKLAGRLGKQISTVSQKKKGVYPFTLNEAKEIKKYLNEIEPLGMTLEELFQTKEVG